MMTPRCAICDRDNDLNTLCDTHHWQATIRRHVDAGTISDWEPLATGKYPRVVNHRTMLLAPAVPPMYWQASILTLLTCAGVVWDDGQPWQESFGDWLAQNWPIDWQAINGGDSGKGQAA